MLRHISKLVHTLDSVFRLLMLLNQTGSDSFRVLMTQKFADASCTFLQCRGQFVRAEGIQAVVEDLFSRKWEHIDAKQR